MAPAKGGKSMQKGKPIKQKPAKDLMGKRLGQCDNHRNPTAKTCRKYRKFELKRGCLQQKGHDNSKNKTANVGFGAGKARRAKEKGILPSKAKSDNTISSDSSSLLTDLWSLKSDTVSNSDSLSSPNPPKYNKKKEATWDYFIYEPAEPLSAADVDHPLLINDIQITSLSDMDLFETNEITPLCKEEAADMRSRTFWLTDMHVRKLLILHIQKLFGNNQPETVGVLGPSFIDAWDSLKTPAQRFEISYPPALLRPKGWIVPLCWDMHWALLHVQGQICYLYNSSDTYEGALVSRSAHFFSTFCPNYGIPIPAIHAIQCQQQTDYSACGVFTAYFARLVIEGTGLNGWIDPYALRRELTKELLGSFGD